MRLELSCCIEGDLDGIADYIAQDNPHRAVTFTRTSEQSSTTSSATR